MQSNVVGLLLTRITLYCVFAELFDEVQLQLGSDRRPLGRVKRGQYFIEYLTHNDSEYSKYPLNV